MSSLEPMWLRGADRKSEIIERPTDKLFAEHPILEVGDIDNILQHGILSASEKVFTLLITRKE